MSYFVTGATGFIGRHLVERLLEREGDIHVLVREGSADKLERAARGLGPGRPRQARRRRPLAAAARPLRRGQAGAAGRRSLLPPRRDLRHDRRRGAQPPRSTSSAPRTRSTSPTSSGPALPPRLLDRGRRRCTRATSPRTTSTTARSSPTPTTARSSRPRSSCASRSRARGASTARRSWSATRRPARWTRSTGPTTSSRRSRRPATRCREWFPLVGLEVGKTNIVPVDYVAAAMDHIAHLPGLDGQAFHLVNPKMQAAGDVMNTFARAGHAPQMVMRVDKRMTDMLPKGVLSYAMKLPALKDIRRSLLADLGIPDSVIEYIGLTADVRRPRHPARARGLGHRAAAARVLRGEAVGLLGAQPRPRPVQGPLVRGRRQRQDRDHHRRLERHRPGGRAQDRRGGRHPAARRALEDKLEEAKEEIERDGGTAYAYSCDLSDTTRSTRWSRRSSPSTPRSTCSSTTRAARSGARWRSPTTASTTTSARSSSTTWARSS